VLTEGVFSRFARRLNGTGSVGVAVSGGGDSVALLHLLAQWGQRPMHVFCVDHGLNPKSAEWTQGVAIHAANAGAAFTALKWDGPKPETGLSAAARTARHVLLADALTNVNRPTEACAALVQFDKLYAKTATADSKTLAKSLKTKDKCPA
jgi:tRNA(Ile)-lysidine synthase TilS/MesJ